MIVLLSGWQLLGGRRLLVVAVAGALLAIAVVAVAPQARERIQRTTLAFGNGEQGVDQALSGRAQIWGAALCMIRAHPFNGVGARGSGTPIRPAIRHLAKRRHGAVGQPSMRIRSCWKSWPKPA